MPVSIRTTALMGPSLARPARAPRALLTLAGPAIVASVAYTDPGNFATNIQAGAAYGYQLLWVVLLASLVAMLFQAMSAKLGIVTGRSLAQLCREEFSRPVVIGMWIGSEIAAMATDLAEFVGGALAVALLLHVPLAWGLAVTGAVTFAILALDRHGFRPLEIAIAVMVAVVSLSYLAELAIAPPDWHAALLHSVVPSLQDKHALMLAVGIVGATIMPHSIYLHSGLMQGRVPAHDDAQRRRQVRFSNREVVFALGLAGLVNMAMVALSAVAFSKRAPGIADIEAAYRSLAPALGTGAAVLFLVSLLASGISSSVVGTLAGQNIMQGFVGVRMPVLVRRLVTAVPAIVVCLCANPMTAIVDSQVVLSVMLPVPLVALVVLSSRRSVMGRFAACRKLTALAALATGAIVALNAALIWQALAG
jgi:manganese transport protein